MKNLKGEGTRLISTYNEQWEEMKVILRKNWLVLKSDPVLAKELSEAPLMMARRSHNLRDVLAKSHYVPVVKNTFNKVGALPMYWWPRVVLISHS